MTFGPGPTANWMILNKIMGESTLTLGDLTPRPQQTETEPH